MLRRGGGALRYPRGSRRGIPGDGDHRHTGARHPRDQTDLRAMGALLRHRGRRSRIRRAVLPDPVAPHRYAVLHARRGHAAHGYRTPPDGHGCHHPAPVLRDHPGALARRGTDHGGVAGRAHAAQAPGNAARGPRVRPGEALAHRSAHLDEHPVHGAATAPRHRVLHDRGRRAVAVGGRCGLPDRAVVHELPAATSWSWPRCGESRRRARRGPARPQTPLWPSPRSGRFEQQTTKAPAGDRGLRVAHVRMRATCRATRPQGHGSQRRSATPQQPPLPDRCRTR